MELNLHKSNKQLLDELKKLSRILYNDIYNLKTKENTLSKKDIDDMNEKNENKNYEEKFFRELYDTIYNEGYYDEHFNNKHHNDDSLNKCCCHNKNKENDIFMDDECDKKCHCHHNIENNNIESDNEYKDYGDLYEDEYNANDVIQDYDNTLEDEDNTEDVFFDNSDLEFNKHSREIFIHELLCILKGIILNKYEDKLNVTFYKKTLPLNSPSAFKYVFKIERKNNEVYDIFIKTKNYVRDMFDYIFNKDLDFSLSVEGYSAEFEIISYI